MNCLKPCYRGLLQGNVLFLSRYKYLTYDKDIHTASSSSNQSDTASSRIEGANGRKDSRRLIFALRIAFISARRGSHTIDRLPSARGPHSMRPWNHPTTLPSATAAAVRGQSSPSSE